MSCVCCLLGWRNDGCIFVDFSVAHFVYVRLPCCHRTFSVRSLRYIQGTFIILDKSIVNLLFLVVNSVEIRLRRVSLLCYMLVVAASRRRTGVEVVSYNFRCTNFVLCVLTFLSVRECTVNLA